MIVYLPFTINQIFWLGILLGINLFIGLFLFIYSFYEVLTKKRIQEANEKQQLFATCKFYADRLTRNSILANELSEKERRRAK